MKNILILLLLTFCLPVFADITSNGMRQGDLVDALIELGSAETQKAFNSGVLAEGTNTAEVKTTAAIVICSGGKFESISTFDDALTATPAEAVPTGYTCYYLFTYDASNDTTEVAKGVNSAVDVSSSVGLSEINFNEDNVVFGGLKIVNTSGSDFTLGKTDLGTVGITETFYNLSHRPFRTRIYK